MGGRAVVVMRAASVPTECVFQGGVQTSPVTAFLVQDAPRGVCCVCGFVGVFLTLYLLRSAVCGRDPPAGAFSIPTRWPAPPRREDLVNVRVGEVGPSARLHPLEARSGFHPTGV